MKKTEYIEIKRQYLPPEVQLIELEVEGMLNDVSPNAVTPDIPTDPNEGGGGNPTWPPFPIGGAKAGTYLIDDEIE